MNFDVAVFWKALTSWAFFEGALVTLSLAVVSHATAILISVPLAVILNEPQSGLRRLVNAYVGLFRAVPTLLQLLFVWNALPQFFPIFRESWFTPFLAAWLALSINESAYQVEINRSALQSIDAGQLAAGEALGLTQLQIYCYVLIPQAIRVAIPPTSNEFITLLKVTSLASVISLQELMTTTQIAVARSFQFTEHYSAALIYYLVMVYTLMGLQSRVERTFSWATRAAPGRKGIAPVFKVDAPRH
jgi:His/Glu/Gln/Arg/opine family amino acid ABC transporter permease subunit